jgi:sugar lactone lactonase YvrE
MEEVRMKTRGWLLTALAVFSLAPAAAQVGKWRNYTSMMEARGVARDGTTYWSATSGGLFAFTATDNRFTTFTNAEGLQRNDLTAVAVDNRGSVWTGTTTGLLHVYSPSETSWRYISDIANKEVPNRRINGFMVHGDSVFICTDFGISAFDLRQFAFRDTYTKFGTALASDNVSVYSTVIAEGKLLAAISNRVSTHRVAVGDLSNPNLLPPEAWALEMVGPSTSVVRSLVVFSGSVYAGTSSGLYRREGTMWTGVPALAGTNIVGVAVTGNVLGVVTTSREVFTMDPQEVVSQYGSVLPHDPLSITMSHTGEPVVASATGGLLTYAGSWRSSFPNGPASNQFISVGVDNSGNVWGASGINGGGKGFYRFDGTRWKSFTSEATGLPFNDYYKVSVGCGGAVYIGSWGRGTVELAPGVDTVTADQHISTNVGIQGIPIDNAFVVAGTTVCDGRGNTWVASLDAADRRVLALRPQGGTWRTLPLYLDPTTNPPSRPISFLLWEDVDRSFAVDAFDNLWSVVRDGAIGGVVSLGNRGQIDSTVAFHITSADGLPSDVVRTIVTDRSNNIWVGTSEGIGIILDPSNPKRPGGIAGYRPLPNQRINTIAVDALNQKWVGTSEGVIVLSPDGTQQIAVYNVENTDGRLIDNNVRSIDIDHETGTVYFGTGSGMASLTTTAIAPVQEFERIIVSPNPFIIPAGKPLLIDGLVENTSLKILSIDGRVVRQVRSPGGRIGFWDGKDDDGTDVASGIYMIVAFSDDGSKVATGKVAVIRR